MTLLVKHIAPLFKLPLDLWAWLDTVNNTIRNSLPEEPSHLLSVNYVEDSTADDLLLCPEALANVHAKGIPDHDIILKKDVLCMIKRYLSVDDGLLNGTKVIIVDISCRILTVRKPYSQTLFAIPRITSQA